MRVRKARQKHMHHKSRNPPNNGEAMTEYEPGGEGRVQRVRNPRKCTPTHQVPKARQKHMHHKFHNPATNGETMTEYEPGGEERACEPVTPGNSPHTLLVPTAQQKNGFPGGINRGNKL
jgi:hypothetical protein